MKLIGPQLSDISYLGLVFRGLVESFPDIPRDILLNYLHKKPGLNQKLSQNDLKAIKMASFNTANVNGQTVSPSEATSNSEDY